MRIPKRYGMSKVETCPFCGKQVLTENGQGVGVCLEHKGSVLPEMKCACGEWLDIRKGKFGIFFNCINCGAVNLRKALEFNPVKTKAEAPPPQGEITITSDEVDL